MIVWNLDFSSYCCWSIRLIFYCCNQQLRQISSKASVLNLILSKLWFLMTQLLQNRPSLRCSLAFSKTFSNMHRQSKLASLVIFFSRKQPATLGILQANSSQSQDRSENAAALNKDLLATEVIEKLKNVHSCFKTLILDVARLLGLSLTLRNQDCWNAES